MLKKVWAIQGSLWSLKGEMPEESSSNPSNRDAQYERFVPLFTRHEPRLRAFVRSLLPTWDDVDEVMQNASLVLWRKFDEFDGQTEDFLRWACVVARFEVLAYRRDKARDRHVFNEDLIQMLSDEALELQDEQRAERRALDHCLTRLPGNLRQVVIAAYQPGVRLNEVAEKIGKSATAFYKLLSRARAQLLDCIELQMKEEKAG